MERNNDYCHKILRTIGEEENEVVIVISLEQMQQAGLTIGDELTVFVRDGEIVIRKVQERSQFG